MGVGDRRRGESANAEHNVEHRKEVLSKSLKEIYQIDAEKKAGEMPEDDAKRGHDAIDKLTKKYEGSLDGLMQTKIKEVTEI